MKPNILVICGRNKRRSRTAEFIFKNDQRFQIRSAGLSAQSNHRLNEKDILWANLILVMETRHVQQIRSQYQHLNLPPIENLHIDDVYEFMDPELVEILKLKFEDLFREDAG